jgi:hypothetical protein
LEELVAGLLRPRLFPFGKLSKAKSAAQYLRSCSPLAASEEKTFRGFLALLLFADFCTCSSGFFEKKHKNLANNDVQNNMNYFIS